MRGALRLPAPSAPGPPQGRARSGAGPARGDPRRALERGLPAARLRSRALRLAEAVQRPDPRVRGGRGRARARGGARRADAGAAPTAAAEDALRAPVSLAHAARPGA